MNERNVLRIGAIQAALKWESVVENLTHFEQVLEAQEEQVDLFLLPETFTTGFTPNIEAHADSDGRTLEWMVTQAARHKSVLAGTILVKESGNYFNRFYWVTASGEVSSYDKRHLFRIGRESTIMTQGNKRVIIDHGPFRILLQTCYDIRFPVFSRNVNDYDMIIYAANFPAARQEVWNTLLRARAIENNAFVVGVNIIGTDGEGVEYAGDSQLIGPKGDIKTRLENQPGVLFCSADLSEVTRLREKFPVYRDADKFDLRLEK